MRTPLAESNSTNKLRLPRNSKSNLVKRKLRDGYTPASDDETPLLAMETDRKASPSFMLSTKSSRNFENTPTSKLPRRPITPSSSAIKPPQNWMSSAAKKMGVKRSTDTLKPKKQVQPASPAIASRIAKAPALHTKSSIPSFKGRPITPANKSPAINKPLPADPSAKPLPSPPIATVTSKTSPPNVSRTLLDASDRPLRKLEGNLHENDWTLLFPESVQSYAEGAKSHELPQLSSGTSKSKVNPRYTNYTVSSFYSQDAALNESDSIIGDNDTSMSSNAGDEGPGRISAEVVDTPKSASDRSPGVLRKTSSIPSIGTRQPTRKTDNGLEETPGVSKFGFFPTTGNRSSIGTLRSVRSSVHLSGPLTPVKESGSPTPLVSGLPKPKGTNLPRVMQREKPTSASAQSVVKGPTDTSVSKSREARPHSRASSTNSSLDAARILPKLPNESSATKLDDAEDADGATSEAIVVADNTTPSNPFLDTRIPSPRKPQPSEGGSLAVKKTRTNSGASVKSKGRDVSDGTSSSSRATTKQIQGLAANAADPFTQRISRLSSCSTVAGYGPTLTISEDAGKVLGLDNNAKMSNSLESTGDRTNGAGSGSRAPSGKSVQQPQRLASGYLPANSSENVLPTAAFEGDSSLLTTEFSTSQLSSAGDLQNETALTDSNTLISFEMPSGSKSYAEDQEQSYEDISAMLDYSSPTAIPEPVAGPMRHMRSTSPHAKLLLEQFSNHEPHAAGEQDYIAPLVIREPSRTGSRAASRTNDRTASRATSTSSTQGSVMVRSRIGNVSSATDEMSDHKMSSGGEAKNYSSRLRQPSSRASLNGSRVASASSFTSSGPKRADELAQRRVEANMAASVPGSARNSDLPPRIGTPQGLVPAVVQHPSDMPRRLSEGKTVARPANITTTTKLSATDAKSQSRIRGKMSSFRQLFQKRDTKGKTKAAEAKPAQKAQAGPSKDRRLAVSTSGSPFRKLTGRGFGNEATPSIPPSPRSPPYTPSQMMRQIPSALRMATGGDASPSSRLIGIVSTIFQHALQMPDDIEKSRVLTMAHAITEAADGEKEAKIAVERAEQAAREARLHYDRIQVSVRQLQGMIDNCGGVRGFINLGKDPKKSRR